MVVRFISRYPGGITRLPPYGALLRQARRDRKFTRDDIVRATGLSPETVTRIEVGYTDVSEVSLIRWLEAIHASDRWRLLISLAYCNQRGRVGAANRGSLEKAHKEG